MIKKHTTGMLFISAALLGAFIWFIERDTETSHQQQQRSRTLFAVYPDTIHSIHMERGDTRIECSKESDEWTMVLPTVAPVNTTIIEQMIAGMAAVERGALITGEMLEDRDMSPSDYGFDEPRARITFENSMGTFTWLIGRDAPLGNSLYVMAEGGEDIISTEKTLLNLVPEDPAWIRDRTLFNTKAAEVSGIDLRRTAGFLRVRQEKENNWRMEQPHAGQADLPGVNALIEHILSARILQFVSDEKADLTAYGLEEPVIELTLFNKTEQTRTLLIGKAVPEKPEELYAKWADKNTVFSVAAEWAAQFELDCDLLRSRRLIGTAAEDFTAVNITSGEQQIELVKTNGEWRVMRPARWTTEPAAVSELLGILVNTSIDAFADDPDETQLERMQNAPWKLTLQAGETADTLKVAPMTDGSRLVQKNEEPSFSILAPGVLGDRFTDPLFYRTRTVLQIDPSGISAISLTSDDQEHRVELKDGQFAAADRTRQADAGALMDLTHHLNTLRTDRYIAFNPDSLSPYGLDNPSAQLKISLSRTNLLGQVLLLGGTIKDGRYAMVQGEDIVFVLPQKTAEALTREFTQSIENQPQETEEP